MDPVSSAVTHNASSATTGSVQGAAAMLVLKKALNAQAAGVAQLVQTLPQPALATSGTLGTQVNTFA